MPIRIEPFLTYFDGYSDFGLRFPLKPMEAHRVGLIAAIRTS